MLGPQEDAVRAYHQRSKHRLQRYAAGPETLDWDAQPDPFRRWAGAPLALLPLVADTLRTPWADLPGGVPSCPVNRSAIGALFELSFALTAWKQHGPDRWALRANPSSGNLHPTEAYLLAAGVTGLDDGLYHYAPREHALELRTPLAAGCGHGAPQLWIGLSSVQWREAWKYGERAFRYCQLDTGHALGALRYAAATLGWQARVVSGIGRTELAALLGLDREADFGGAEAEEPELLVQLGPVVPEPPALPRGWTTTAQWQGRANRLDARPMYRWPVIDEVAAATREPARRAAAEASPEPAGAPCLDTPLAPAGPSALPSPTLGTLPAATLIRQRRSAQHFDRRASMPIAAFLRIAAAVMPDAGLPWDAWPHPPRVHAVLYAHRVDGLAPGAYVLPRSGAGAKVLAEALQAGEPWQPVAEAPTGVPLARIAEHPALAGTLRTLSCHQAIASDACFAMSLLAEFEAPLASAPWRYRQLFQEAGLIGQVLYLQAEAEGFRGTGIGCYFDDAVHELLGLAGERLQVLYHFTVGMPLADARLGLEAPYADRAPIAAPDGSNHE
ncbi:nitroreductase [Methylibium sp.]|uniref:nitroreductase n=1 Tax=Methylibium sp. TaxID=2067992 RepID=UPI003D10FB5D